MDEQQEQILQNTRVLVQDAKDKAVEAVAEVLNDLERDIPAGGFSRAGEVRKWFRETEKKHLEQNIERVFTRIASEIK